MKAHDQYETAKKLAVELGLGQGVIAFTIPQYEAHHDQLCREQRENCLQAYKQSDWVEVNECANNILNAPKPTI